LSNGAFPIGEPVSASTVDPQVRTLAASNQESEGVVVENVVRTEKDGAVAVVWLSNPKKRNAMGNELFEQLPQAFHALAADPGVRAIVLAAEGPAFTVGLDLVAMQSTLAPTGGPIEQRQHILREVARLQGAMNAVYDCPVPVVAAIHGWCIGGGVDLVSACDIRLASADMKLSVRETKVGIVADLGTLQRLPRIISAGHAAELIYTGKDIDARRAKEIGLVNDVYESVEEVQSAARKLAGEIAANSPLVVRGVKNVLRFSEDKPIAEGLKYVGVWNSAFLLSEDLMEAMAAFMQKRPPEFSGK
jgi:enoyl-CoA hydratase